MSLAADSVLSSKVIGLAIEVHRRLGPGLLEAVYERCLCFELARNGIGHVHQAAIPVVYDGIQMDCGFRIDIFVERQLIIEIKAVEKLHPIHLAQMVTYLKLADCQVGLLINFNVKILKDGLRRIIRN